MATQTICDKCGDVIERVEGELTTFTLTISCKEEDVHGDFETTDEVELELCGDCNDAAKKALYAADFKVF